METLTSFINTLVQDWEIIVAAFVFGGLYYEAKRSFRKIMDGLQNTGHTHQAQNIILDSINDKIDNLDKRMAKIEGSVEMIIIDNHEQTVRLSVLETHLEIDKTPTRKRRQRVQ